MKIAGVQMNVEFAAPARNLAWMTARCRDAARAGARLVIFPECAVAGYCFEDPAEALTMAQPISGPAADCMTRTCLDLDCYALFGMLELDGKRLFNTAVLTGPNGIIATYRKIHLPLLGADRF